MQMVQKSKYKSKIIKIEKLVWGNLRFDLEVIIRKMNLLYYIFFWTFHGEILQDKKKTSVALHKELFKCFLKLFFIFHLYYSFYIYLHVYGLLQAVPVLPSSPILLKIKHKR
jgi:hypothetical protein